MSRPPGDSQVIGRLLSMHRRSGMPNRALSRSPKKRRITGTTLAGRQVSASRQQDFNDSGATESARNVAGRGQVAARYRNNWVVHAPAGFRFILVHDRKHTFGGDLPQISRTHHCEQAERRKCLIWLVEREGIEPSTPAL